MRIACVVGTWPKRSETFIAREVAALREQRAEIVIFPLWPGDEEAEDESVQQVGRWGVAEQLIYPWKHSRWQFRFLGAVRREGWGTLQALWHEGRMLAMGHRMRKLGIEHVHAQFGNAVSTAGWMAADVADVPFSVSVHARDVFVEPQFLREKAEAARCIVACNSAAAARTRELAGPANADKVQLVPHGLPLDDYPFRERLPEGPPLILGVGRLVEKKGFPFLLRALGELRRDGVPFRAMLIGEGPERDVLETEIVELGLDETVALTGWLPHDQVRAAYERASVLVAPSIVAEDGDRDGLPNVVLEAAAVGVPVVATDVGGLPDLVRDSETGWGAGPKAPDALAGQIRAVLDSPQEAMARAEAARAAVEKRFDIRDCTDQLIAALGLDLGRR